MNNSIRVGQQAIDSTIPEKLDNVPSNCTGFMVKNLVTNTGAIALSNLSTVTLLTGYLLQPGESIPFEMQNPGNHIYYIAEVDEEKVCWIAVLA